MVEEGDRLTLEDRSSSWPRRPRAETWPADAPIKPESVGTSSPELPSQATPAPGELQSGRSSELRDEVQGSPPPASLVGVDRVRMGARAMRVETVWSIELPPCPPEFECDVELTNGLTIVVPHPREHADGSWFAVAKDGHCRRQLVARFQCHGADSAWRLALESLGSPLLNDLASMAVLLLALLLCISPAEVVVAGGGGGGGQSTREPARLVPAADPASSWRRAGGMPWLRVCTFVAVGCASLGKLATRLTARYPPTCKYTLVIKPSAGDDEQGFDGAQDEARHLAGLDDGSALSPLEATMGAFAAAISAPLPADAGGDGAAPALAGEVELLVEPLCDAIEEMLRFGRAFGPVMLLVNQNCEANLRKVRKVIERFGATEPKRVSTLRGLLEAEKATGIHRPGAVLADPSAAIALLWTRRTLQFFLQCLIGTCEMGGSATMTMSDVAAAAYRMHLEPFHGWFLKNTFTLTLNGVPSRESVLQKICGSRRLSHETHERDSELAAVREIRECIDVLRVVVDGMRALFEELDLEDMRKV